MYLSAISYKELNLFIYLQNSRVELKNAQEIWSFVLEYSIMLVFDEFQFILTPCIFRIQLTAAKFLKF